MDLKSCLFQEKGFPFLLAKEMQPRAGVALKMAAQSLGSVQQKNRLWLHHKSRGSVRNTAQHHSIVELLHFGPGSSESDTGTCILVTASLAPARYPTKCSENFKSV